MNIAFKVLFIRWLAFQWKKFAYENRRLRDELRQDANTEHDLHPIKLAGPALNTRFELLLAQWRYRHNKASVPLAVREKMMGYLKQHSVKELP